MSAITGAVPRVQPIWPHTRLVNLAEPDCVMLRLDGAKRLLDRTEPESADSYFPENTSVITSAIRLANGRTSLKASSGIETRVEELEVVKEFEPDYHIPADPPQHVDHAGSGPRSADRSRLFGETRWMDSQLTQSNTSILPCVRSPSAIGTSTFHDIVETLDPPVVAYTESTLPSDGTYHLRGHIQSVDERWGSYPLLIIGCRSPEALKADRIPANTVGAAGLNFWRNTVRPEHRDREGIIRQFESVQDAVTSALLPSQSVSPPTTND